MADCQLLLVSAAAADCLQTLAPKVHWRLDSMPADSSLAVRLGPGGSLAAGFSDGSPVARGLLNFDTGC